MEGGAEQAQRRDRVRAAVPRVAGALALLIASLALIGYFRGIRLFTAVLPGRKEIPPLTAATGTLAALALLLAQAGRCRLARALGGLVLTLGLLMVVGRQLGWAHLAPALTAQTGLGRPRLLSLPPVTTALALAGLGLALLLGRAGPRRALLADVGAWTAAAVAAVGALVYLYGAPYLYRLPGRQPEVISFPAVLILSCLATGLLWAEPRRGAAAVLASRGPGGGTARRLLPGALLGPTVVGLLSLRALRSGLEDPATALAVLAAAGIAVALALLLPHAAALDRAARRREQLLAELGRAREAERRLAARLEAVGQAAGAVVEAVANLPRTDLEAVLNTVVLQARSLTGADYAAVGLGDDPDRPFDPWVEAGLPPGGAPSPAPRPVGLLGRVAREGRALCLADLRGRPGARGLPAGLPAVRAFLGVPIRFAGRSLGSLFLGSRRPGAFSEEDQRTIELLAARTGASLESALAYRSQARARAWLEDVIVQMPGVVLVTDAGGRLLTSNEAALEFLDRSAHSRLDLELRRPDGSPLAWDEAPLGRALAGEPPGPAEEVLVRARNGRLVPTLMSAARLHDPEVGGPGAVCVLRDITALKELERLREEWIAVVAHDLRQPITVINMAAGLLTRSRPRLAPSQDRAVAHILSAAQRLERMTADLLDASRLDARRLRLELAPLRPEALVREVVERLAPALGGREVRLDLRPCPRVRADASRLEQVLTNLLVNADKYGGPGTPIAVAVYPAGDEVRVRVTNQGPGLTREELAGLFRRFGRTAAAERSKVAGLGLGLYICRGLVEAQGGRIWAESQPGGETAFEFALPAAQGPLEEAAPAPGP